MSFFNNFPEVNYVFANNCEINFTNISAYSSIFSQVRDSISTYKYYDVIDGERPDIVSQKLYGTPDYFWTFFLMNPELKIKGWPLSVSDLESKLNEDIPGECLVFLPQDEVDVGDTTGFLQHSMIDNFPIGSDIYGQISGAAGEVYSRNINLGQIYVKKTNSLLFQRNETVVDIFDGQPSSRLITRMVYNPAGLAPQKFVDGEGDNVDIDFALDFRGRGPEGDVNVIGGVVGDLDNPDPFAANNSYTYVSWREHYENENRELSRIKIIKPELIDQIVQLRNNSFD